MSVRTRPVRLAASIALALVWSTPAAAQQRVPRSVRLLHPSCAGPLAWDELAAALRVELRTMGSDLADSGEAPARLAVDVVCTADASSIDAMLVHVESGRSVVESIELGARGDAERTRNVALSLSELVRAHWASLLEAPPAPPAPAPVDTAALRAEIERSVVERIERELPARAREAVRAAMPAPPAPRLPGHFFDVALAVSAYPASSNALGELRVAASLQVLDAVRVGVELAGGGGWAGDALGDVALGALGGAVSLRFTHATDHLVIGAGPRIDVGWIHAEGIPRTIGVVGGALDAAHVALGADLRARVRLDGAWWLMAGAELGASVAGLDARADDRRVTAQIGPRVGLVLGASWIL